MCPCGCLLPSKSLQTGVTLHASISCMQDGHCVSSTVTASNTRETPTDGSRDRLHVVRPSMIVSLKRMTTPTKPHKQTSVFPLQRSEPSPTLTSKDHLLARMITECIEQLELVRGSSPKHREGLTVCR